MRVLGIETSCDETGIAIYDSVHGLLSNVLYSQIKIHQQYGGVVPELASRDHVRKIMPLIQQAILDANLQKESIDAIAYTTGPGLIGALLVGASVAKSLAFAWNIPAIAVHHMEAHLLAPCLEKDAPDFPFIALLVSGGHTQLIQADSLGTYTILGESLDDAAGEAFDKIAKILGLPYPGGAPLSKLAEHGDPKRFHFPRPMVDRPGLDFSFSGLKTFALNVFRTIEYENHVHEQDRADIARAFQDAIVDTLAIKCKRALEQTGCKRLVVAGGVSANTALRHKLQTMVETLSATVYYPRLDFCTDNGAMIAYCGCKKLELGYRDSDLAIRVFPRYKLDVAYL